MFLSFFEKLVFYKIILDLQLQFFQMKHIIAVLLVLLYFIDSSPILDNLPITFKMLGPITYNPDAGGSALNGYKINIGYTGHSWIAVQFPDTAKTDVLVITANDFYTKTSDQFSGHQVLVKDYFYNSTGILQQDTNTSKDISSFNYTQIKAYQLTVTRFLGSLGGQDWNSASKKYTVQKVCFYTSSNSFDPSKWNQGLSVCYYFQINNLISKFVGKNLKSFSLNGYQTKIYGWISGPYLTQHIYIFQQAPLFTYTRQPAIILQLGQTLGGYGQDFYVFSPTQGQTGDYYGTAVSSIKKDCQTGGFQNNGLSAQFWNADPGNQIASYGSTALRIMFSRNISTFDNYDKKLLSTFIFCIHLFSQGSIVSQLSDKQCQIVELSSAYVKQQIPTNFQPNLVFGILSALFIIVLI